MATMGTGVQTVLGLLAILLLLAPACFLIYAAAKARRLIGGAGATLISVGAILLTISSLDFLYAFVVALLFEANELARFSLASTYVFTAMNYVALLAIGLGLLTLTRRFATSAFDRADT